MDARKLVLTQTGIVAVGEAVCTAAMVGIFALLHHMDGTVVLGAVLGAVLAVGNFFFMALGAMRAADQAQAQDVKRGKATVRSSMIGRLAVLAVLLIVLIRSGYCNALATLIPLMFTRPVLTVWEFFGKSGGQKV